MTPSPKDRTDIIISENKATLTAPLLYRGQAWNIPLPLRGMLPLRLRAAIVVLLFLAGWQPVSPPMAPLARFRAAADKKPD